MFPSSGLAFPILTLTARVNRLAGARVGGIRRGMETSFSTRWRISFRISTLAGGTAATGGTSLKSLFPGEETIVAARAVVAIHLLIEIPLPNVLALIEFVICPSQSRIHKGCGGIGVVKRTVAVHALCEEVAITPTTSAQGRILAFSFPLVASAASVVAAACAAGKLRQLPLRGLPRRYHPSRQVYVAPDRQWERMTRILVTDELGNSLAFRVVAKVIVKLLLA